MAVENYEYDVFISYAVEDKIGIVNELVQRLEEYGIKVWYASHRLRVGRGVSETIREGLNKSRHGIVILSHNYLSKAWPKKEYHVLWGLVDGKLRRILPVWYNISEEEVKCFDPLLCDRYGLNINKGLDNIVRELVENLREKPIKSSSSVAEIGAESKKKSLYLFALILILAGLGLILVLELMIGIR